MKELIFFLMPVIFQFPVITEQWRLIDRGGFASVYSVTATGVFASVNAVTETDRKIAIKIPHDFSDKWVLF